MKLLIISIFTLFSTASFATEEVEILKNNQIEASMVWSKLEKLYKAGSIGRAGPIGDAKTLAKDYHIDEITTSEFTSENLFCVISYKLKSNNSSKEMIYRYTLETETFASKSSEDEKNVKSFCSPYFNGRLENKEIFDSKREAKEKSESSSEIIKVTPSTLQK